MQRSKSLALSIWIYRWLLLAYPRRFRREFGAEMAQLFRDLCRDALRQRGKRALVLLWIFTCLDLVQSAVAEHLAEVFHMSTRQFLRWSGPAAVVAGALWSFMFQADWVFLPDLATGALFLGIMLLFAYGLAGLIPHWSKGLSTTLTFGATFLALLVTPIFGVLVLLTRFGNADWGWIVFIGGMYLLATGLLGVGLVGAKSSSLGRWGFLPVLLGIFLLGFIISGGAESIIVQTIFNIAYGLSWAVLGIVLWRVTADTPDMPLPA